LPDVSVVAGKNITIIDHHILRPGERERSVYSGDMKISVSDGRATTGAEAERTAPVILIFVVVMTHFP
jgi:hypothetical protein